MPWRRPVVWQADAATCPVCGREWPWPDVNTNNPRPLQYLVCQVCLVADLARVVRECPERFRFLPSHRIALGLPLVQEVQR
jgi:hypothetical protein